MIHLQRCAKAAFALESNNAAIASSYACMGDLHALTAPKQQQLADLVKIDYKIIAEF